jgi:TolB-like protein
MAEVFISYARSTAETAQAMARALRESGYSVWIDDDLPAHRDFPTVIEENLRAAKAVVVIWSAEARRSRWVPAEADVAHGLGTLVQVSLDGAEPPLPFNRMQCVNLPDWRGEVEAPGWRKILEGVGALVGRSALEGEPGPARPGPSGRERLLAVLPFDNVSGDPDLAYFSDGVSEEIQNAVSKIAALKVVARASSFQFRGADKAVRHVAAELKATHLLDGSVRRSGSRVRITAEFVECAGESTLWSDRFDGDLGDIFDLQERIAAAVADALKLRLAPTAEAPALEPWAYETFLKARGVITEGGGLLDDTAEQASPLLEAVVQAEPGYAPAWELLANARAWTLRSNRRAQAYADGRAAVVEAAETALRLDPRRGGAYTALALLEPWGAYAARESLLKKALELSPNDPVALTDMSTFCWSVGRFREALKYAERACDLNPLMPAARLQVAQMRTYVGDYEASIRMHLEIRKRWPHNLPILASLLNFAASLGFWDAYREGLEAVATFSGWQAAHLRASVSYAETLASSDPDRREALVETYRRWLEKSGTLPLNYIEAVSALGLPETALELAEQASFDHVLDPDGPLPSGNFPGTVLGRWSALNKTPRFVDLCDRLGLCAYWASTHAWPDCVDWAPYDFKAEVLRRAARPSSAGLVGVERL